MVTCGSFPYASRFIPGRDLGSYLIQTVWQNYMITYRDDMPFIENHTYAMVPVFNVSNYAAITICRQSRSSSLSLTRRYKYYMNSEGSDNTGSISMSSLRYLVAVVS